MNKFPMDLAYRFVREQGFAKDADAIRSAKLQKWKYRTSVRRGLLVELMVRHQKLDAFSAAVYPDLTAESAKENCEAFEELLSEYRALTGDSAKEELVEQTLSEAVEEQSLEFAIEAHLRDFLAKNLHLLETGLRLYQHEKRNGVEFPVTGGRIDILAVDADGRPVVVELKLSMGRNKVLGQILYYMGWVDQNLKIGQSRGIIVANEITEDLVIASRQVPNVSLAQYRMRFEVAPVVKS